MCRGSLWCSQSGDDGVCNGQEDQTYFEQLTDMPCTATFTVRKRKRRGLIFGPIQ